jgi:hypothetical protein
VTFGKRVLDFYKGLTFSNEDIPGDIEVMEPMKDPQIQYLNELFYSKYYNDNKERVFLIGINPGRFGGGVTGIPFTDPVNLQEILEIDNPLQKRHELSSKFMYQVVEAMGGPEIFFGKIYLTAISPLGFVMNGKNINYYDNQELSRKFEEQFALWLKEQIGFGASSDVAFSLGRGKNYKFLMGLNEKYNLFKSILALPHPRWVMQYRYSKRKHFVDLYLEQLSRLK